MNEIQIHERDKISAKYKWDIEKMYPNDELWEVDIQTALDLSLDFLKFKGNITNSSDLLFASLNEYFKIFQIMEKALCYAHMKHDEDTTLDKYIKMNDKASKVASQILGNLSFFTTELLSSDKALIDKYMNTLEDLKKYNHFINSLFLEKDHILSEKEEKILALMEDSLSAPSSIFGAINNADIDFGSIIDDNGNSLKVTHGNFVSLMESGNRNIRRDVYNAIFNQYKNLNHTISTTYNFNVKTHELKAQLRGYKNGLEAELSPNQIPISVYDNLISEVHRFLPSMHKYMHLKKEILGLSQMSMYDIYTPLAKPSKIDISFNEAIDIMCNALSPLGRDYIEILTNGINNERWVDIFENKGKASGAYSFGSYDSYPYILMNFDGTLKDVFTLIHESGHSMHSYYTRQTQPFIYGGHSIFTAEVASTVNETLLINYLIDNEHNKNDLIYLLNFYIDEFKSTLFRQTMFAEFEKYAHEVVNQGGSLSNETLNSKYKELNKFYYGDAITDDDLIEYEWSRIPHFYRSFYVYQYATGYSAANAIATNILVNGENAVNNYKKFLSLGDSDYPIQLLKIAGVDMSTPEPVHKALEIFDHLIEKLSLLIER